MFDFAPPLTPAQKETVADRKRLIYEGASFLRRDGTVWTTDEDGIVAALLSAEITARSGHDPAETYRALTRELGDPAADRIEAPATADQKRRLAALSPTDVHLDELGGERVERVLDRAPGKQAPIGGIKVVTASGWFAARPSGTEDIYKIPLSCGPP